MKVELSLDELLTIKIWGETLKIERNDWDADDDHAMGILEDAIEQAQELEELDLDDCASGACRL